LILNIGEKTNDDWHLFLLHSKKYKTDIAKLSTKNCLLKIRAIKFKRLKTNKRAAQ
jgi:hypothetical protein